MHFKTNQAISTLAVNSLKYGIFSYSNKKHKALWGWQFCFKDKNKYELPVMK